MPSETTVPKQIHPNLMARSGLYTDTGMGLEEYYLPGIPKDTLPHNDQTSRGAQQGYQFQFPLLGDVIE